MWYADQDQFVRAPTPESFNRLVDHLENNDSVLFQSITLPSAPDSSEQTLSTPLDPDSFTSTDDETETVKQQIQKVLELNRQRDEILRQRNAKIADLRKQIEALQTKQSPVPPNADGNLTDYYKSQYESTSLQLNKLREALAAGETRSKK
jgi:uncharacterized protein YukE